MQIINFLHYQNYDVSSVGERIDICPRHNTLDTVDKYSRIFREPREEQNPTTFTTLWDNLEIWINNTYPWIESRAVRFCTYHLAHHFQLNYCYVRDTVENLLPFLGNEVGVLCDEEMLVVEADWCSSLITLLAVIDVLEKHDKKITYHAIKPNMIENLIRFSPALYAGLDCVPSIADADYEVLISRVKHFDKIAYGPARRFLTQEHYDLRLIPKSLSNDATEVGLLHQFENEKTFENTPSSYESWSNHCISKSNFSRTIESKYFDFLNSRLLSKIAYLEPKFTSEFGLFKRQKTLILEEIIDIEAMAFLSAWIKSGNLVQISPHSGNFNPSIYEAINYGKSFVSRIYTNSNFVELQYKNMGEQVDTIQLKKQSDEVFYFRENQFSDTVILIENDFIRRWGCSLNIEEVIADCLTFLTILHQKNHGLKFIWKQRNKDSTAIYDYIKKILPALNLVFSDSYNLNDLVIDSRLSVSFGKASNFAYDLVRLGVVNLFASFHTSREYVPKIELFHQEFSPVFAATKAHVILNDYNKYLLELQRQQKFLSEM